MSTTMNVGRILRHHQYQNVTQERNVYLSCAKRRMESRASSLSVLAMRQDMPQRHRWCSLMREGRRRSGVVANAGRFDEGAAQVRRLLDRDRQDIDFDAVEKAFADDSENKNSSAGTSPRVNADNVDKTASSSSPGKPIAFGKSSGSSPVSPFGGSPTSSSFESGSVAKKSPFAEPSDLQLDPLPDKDAGSANSKPWWSQITLFQIAIVLSFTLIVSSMVATTLFVIKVGGIHFNE